MSMALSPDGGHLLVNLASHAIHLWPLAPLLRQLDALHAGHLAPGQRRCPTQSLCRPSSSCSGPCMPVGRAACWAPHARSQRRCLIRLHGGLSALCASLVCAMPTGWQGSAPTRRLPTAVHQQDIGQCPLREAELGPAAASPASNAKGRISPHPPTKTSHSG